MKISNYVLLGFFTAVLLLSCDKPKPENKTIEPVKKDTVSTTAAVVEAPEQNLTKEQQIAAAVLSALEETREGVKVYGYDSEGKFINLREGTNEMICIADDVNKDGFKAVSYHKYRAFYGKWQSIKSRS